MIDYNLISASINYYEDKGFKRVEVPWMVTEAVDSITRPDNIQPFIVEAKNKNLIASGEQGFLYLYLKRYLPKGKFQTVTPCFRNDPFDFTHSKYFIKNELIQTDIVTKEELCKIVSTSKEFFDKIFPIETHVEKTEDGYDILLDNVELGSYGIRSCEFLTWIYGTGCAEPRTSRLIELYNK